MKVALILIFVIYEATSAVVPIIQHSHAADSTGQFSLSYQSADGTSVTEQGAFKPTNAGTSKVLVKQGSYSYLSPDGTPKTISYIADEYGFRVNGNHLPVAPTPLTPQPVAPAFVPQVIPTSNTYIPQAVPASNTYIPQVVPASSTYIPQAFPAQNTYVPGLNPYVSQYPAPGQFGFQVRGGMATQYHVPL